MQSVHGKSTHLKVKFTFHPLKIMMRFRNLSHILVPQPSFLWFFKYRVLINHSYQSKNKGTSTSLFLNIDNTAKNSSAHCKSFGLIHGSNVVK